MPQHVLKLIRAVFLLAPYSLSAEACSVHQNQLFQFIFLQKESTSRT